MLLQNFNVPMDHYPEHAMALGRFVAHWALVERQLIGVLAIISKTDYPRAQTIYQEFPSLSGKFKLIRRLSYAVLYEADRKKLLNLISQAQALSDLRNTYLHATYIGNGPPEELYIVHGTPLSDPKHYNRFPEVFALSKILEDILRIDALLVKLIPFVSAELPGLSLRQ